MFFYSMLHVVPKTVYKMACIMGRSLSIIDWWRQYGRVAYMAYMAI